MRVGPIDLVIVGWPCQGHTQASRGEARAPAYILKNVLLLGDIRFHVMVNVHEIRSWIGPSVLLDVARVGLCAHHP